MGVSLYFSPKKWKKTMLGHRFVPRLLTYNTGYPIREYIEDPGLWCLHASSAHTQGALKSCN